MKRLLAIASFAVMLMFGLAACATPAPTNPSTATPSGGGATATTQAATSTASMTGTVTMTGTAVTTNTPEATMVMTSTPAMTATMTITGAPGTTGTTSSTAGAVQVSLREYAIDMPHTLPAGPTTFAITNNGAVQHSFTIEGQGIEKELEQNLQPSEKATLQINLKAGSYDVYCPVDAHEGKGMKVQLTVQ